MNREVAVKRYSFLAFVLWSIFLVPLARSVEPTETDYWLLFVPAFSHNDGEAVRITPQLIRMEDQSKGQQSLMQVWPMLYIETFRDKKTLKDRALKYGLTCHTVTGKGAIRIKGVTLANNAMGYDSVVFEGNLVKPSLWKGSCVVQPAPYYRLGETKYLSSWAMVRASDSAITECAVDCLRQLQARLKNDGRAWQTREDVIAFLRGQDEDRWPKQGFVRYSMDRPFAHLAASLLESGTLQFESGTIKSDVAVFEAILADLDLDRNVRVDEPKRDVLSYTDEDRASRPPITARRIRLIARKDEVQRERMLARLSNAERAYIEQTNLSWDELAHVPDAVFLADHLGALPKSMQSKIADGYIRDGGTVSSRG
jgi:hypothetical protein